MKKFNLHKYTLGIVTPVGKENQDLEKFILLVLKNCELYFKNIKFYLITDKITSNIALKIIDTLSKDDERIIKIWEPSNKNVVDAYKQGYKKAVKNVDYILEIDAGFSHDPNQIPLFLQTINLNFSCSLGVRFGLKNSNYKGNFKRFFISYGGTKLINLFLGTKIPDMTSGYSLYSKKCLLDILKMGINSKSPFFQSEMRYYVKNKQYFLVPITYKSPSYNVNFFSIFDSLFNLYRLTLKRIYK